MGGCSLSADLCVDIGVKLEPTQPYRANAEEPSAAAGCGNTAAWSATHNPTPATLSALGPVETYELVAHAHAGISKTELARASGKNQ